MPNTSEQDELERALDKIKITIEFEPNKLPKFVMDTREAKSDILTLHQSELRKAERRGEVSQLRFLRHWMVLHKLSAEVDDIDHLITSIEQFPNQPLASENLAVLTHPNEQEGTDER